MMKSTVRSVESLTRESAWLREALRSLAQGGMCTLCLSETAKGESHDAQCPVGAAVRQADLATDGYPVSQVVRSG